MMEFTEWIEDQESNYQTSDDHWNEVGELQEDEKRDLDESDNLKESEL